MILCSLDLSLSDSGMCIFSNDELLLSESIKSSRRDDSIKGRYDRYFEIKDNIAYFLNNYDYFDVIAIERQSFGSKGHLTDLAESKAIILNFLLNKYDDAKYFEISPMTLKSFILNGDKIPRGTKSDIAKEIIMNKCNQVYNTFFDNNNIADAYILGKYVLKNIDNLKESTIKVKKKRKKKKDNKWKK